MPGAIRECCAATALTRLLRDLAHDVSRCIQQRGRVDLMRRPSRRQGVEELVGVLVVGLLVDAAQLQVLHLARREAELPLDRGSEIGDVHRAQGDLAEGAHADDGDAELAGCCHSL